jgi:hypothetical protein
MASRYFKFREGLDMFAPLCASVAATMIVNANSQLMTEPLHLDSNPAIKLLDLLSNRYHIGRVRSRGGNCIEIELPVASRLHAGQRVRFALGSDGEATIVSKQDMRGAIVTHATPTDEASMHVELSLLAEAAAA